MQITYDSADKSLTGENHPGDQTGSQIHDQCVFNDKNFVLHCLGDQAHMQIPSGIGHGWVATIRLNQGLMIGLCDYRLNHVLEGGYSDQNKGADNELTLGFNFLISGSFDLFFQDMAPCQSVQSGRLYLCRGSFETLRYKQHNSHAIKGLSIEMPATMIQAWLEQSCDPAARTLEKWLGTPSLPGRPSFNRLIPLTCSPKDLFLITRMCAGLLAMPQDTICARLQFESTVLDLLATLLSLDHGGLRRHADWYGKRRAAVDEAVDILRTEWAAPPTISALARRVGINECYLKMEFRRCTGFSIGGFVRKMRMEKALELIESGTCNILQTACSVGYSNPSHFSAAFKRYYGHSPSFYLARN